jgi:hypothetical protein
VNLALTDRNARATGGEQGLDVYGLKINEVTRREEHMGQTALLEGCSDAKKWMMALVCLRDNLEAEGLQWPLWAHQENVYTAALAQDGGHVEGHRYAIDRH